MPVPGFQKYFLPFLELIKDGKEYAMTELYESLANHFGLSDEDKNELLPSGLQTRHMKRVQLARTFLNKALLIENSKRAEVRIIERGIKLLAENPQDINSKIFWTVVDGVSYLKIQNPWKWRMEEYKNWSGGAIFLAEITRQVWPPNHKIKFWTSLLR